MPSRCQLCGSACSGAQTYCSKNCAHAAKEAAKDGIEARLRRAFQRRRRPPSGAPDPEARQMFFEVGGFWTGGCASAAEEILKSVKGVFDAQVVPGTGRGRVFYDPERLAPRDILRTIRRYGMRATQVRDAWARAEGFSRAWEIALAVRLGVAAMLTIHVLYFTALLKWDRISSARDAESLTVLLFFLTLPVLFYGGLPILSNALWAIARRRVTADLLTAAASFGALVLSLPGLFGRGPVYFDAACAAVVLTLFARFAEYRARRRLARAGEKLAGMISGEAIRLRRGEEIPCTAVELRPGDVVLVTAGTRIPVDGDVVEGNGVIEAIPAGATEVSAGDRVGAGARLASGRLTIRAERTGAATSVGEMSRIIDSAITSRLPGSEAAASGLVWIGGATALFGLMALAWQTGTLESLTAVLLVVSPSAVALLPTISGLSAMGRAAERLACFRGGDSLAAAASVDAVVLTRSSLVEPRAMATPCAIGGDPAEFWSVVATLVAVAPGPAAAALRERARIEGAAPPMAVAPTEGRVARARVDGRDAALGDRTALEALGWRIVPGAESAKEEEAKGRSLVWVGWDGAIQGAVAVDARDRQGADRIGAGLKRAGCLTCLAGTDADAALDAQANRLGLDTWLSEDRLGEHIVKRNSLGRRTALVTRASTDAPPGAEAADLVCALDCGEEAAPEWAEVLVLGGDVRSAEAALGSARRAAGARRMGGAMAFLYHAAALPCAVAGLLDPLTAVGLSAAFELWLVYVGFRAGGNPLKR